MRSPLFSDLIEDVVSNKLSELHTALPARIVEYVPAEQKATVQPLIKRKYRDSGNDSAGLVDMPIIYGVPVMFPSAATGAITFPIKTGDIVLLVFCERSLDKFLLSDGQTITDPEDFRQHNYSDAFAIPGLYPFREAVGSDPNNVVIRFNIGTANENKVTLKTNGDVQVDTPAKFVVNATGDIQMTTQGKFTVSSASDSTINAGGKLDAIATGVVTINGSTINIG